MRRRAAIMVLGLVGIVALQVWGMERRIRTVDSTQYAQRAYPLKVGAGWRYGFIHEYHGAMLVKARDPGPPPSSARAPWMTDMAPFMSAELERVPWLAVAEGALYLGCLAYLVLGAGRLLRKLTWASGTPARRATGVAVVVGLLYLLLLLPRLSANYGCSAYTRWIGAFPTAFTPGYDGLTLAPAETVTYRPVLEVVCWPLMLPGRLYPHSLVLVALAMAYAWLGSWIAVRHKQAIARLGWMCTGVLCLGGTLFLLQDMVQTWLYVRTHSSEWPGGLEAGGGHMMSSLAEAGRVLYAGAHAWILAFAFAIARGRRRSRTEALMFVLLAAATAAVHIMRHGPFSRWSFMPWLW